MTSSPTIKLSVILVEPSRYHIIRKTVRHLSAQSNRHELELILVTASAAEMEYDREAVKEFGKFQLVEVGPIHSDAAARLAGVRQASASIVVFAEDHCFPNEGWAEALLKAHTGPWVAVGPVIANANPASLMSWATLYINYGRWVEPAAGGELDDLPGHNTSYKREVLLAYGDRAERLMARETLLHWDLRAHGHAIYQEPAAQVSHINISKIRSAITDQFCGGQLFAATRAKAEAWSLFRRLIYVLATPYFIARRIYQILFHIRRTGRFSRLMPQVLPAILVVCIARGLGETVGCLLGAGNAQEILQNYEFDRLPNLVDRDRAALLE